MLFESKDHKRPFQRADIITVRNKITLRRCQLADGLFLLLLLDSFFFG